MTTLRGPGVKSVGKPDAGNRHVRFDERGRETGQLAPRPSSTLPKPWPSPTAKTASKKNTGLERTRKRPPYGPLLRTTNGRKY